ncbi:MarR family transcriptional regulator [Bradyrhizobium sp. SSUT112]|uniref:MarR family winged helix-turn-helix transcriptional regulator n=1 Tax=Bradyrhizobium sp. SSUT112 TaxID=3040604 RepID=UPI00244A17DC|nr:MarR family transcriptional regulator [Bradyrhizobium sp. SSUT112]MDH2357724.1 MarR family transcriptional regulator [Bradyrhizobium sp. SSUT112]
MAKQAIQAGNGSAESQELVRRLTLEIRTLNVCLEDFLHVRAEALGITGTQLGILMALTDLGKNGGAPAGVLAKLMKVDPSFITLHSKALEKLGFIRRKPGIRDARVVQLSLTDKARKRLANIAAQQQEVDQFVFGELGNEELTRLSSRLAALRKRLESARLKAELESGAVSARGWGRR